MPNRLARALRCLSLLVPSLYADDCSVAAPEAAAQCALLRPWSNPKLECNVASKANDGITNVFTEKSHKYSLVFML